MAATTGVPGSHDPFLPIVVPLLVTDNIESANDAVSAQFIAELAAALSGASQGVAFGGQLQSLNDRINKAAASERNALRTVARLGQNAIRVRFGATLQAGPTGRKDYELLPRTHTISLLVLVPHDAMQADQAVPLGIVARTVLKDVRRGEQLDLGATATFRSGLYFIVDRFKIENRLENYANCDPGSVIGVDFQQGKSTRESAYDWINDVRSRYVTYGDYKSFYKSAFCVFTNGRESRATERDKVDARADVEDLWQALLSFNGDYSVQGQTVDLPPVETPRLPSSGLTVILTDDGKSITTARLSKPVALDASRLVADLCHTNRTGDCEDRFAATSISVDQNTVTLTYPSLLALGLVSDAKPKELNGFKIIMNHPEVTVPTERKDAPSAEYKKLRYAGGPSTIPKKAELSADIVSADRIVAIGGQGKLTVGIALDAGQPPQAAYVKVSGAEVDSATGGELDPLGVVKIASSGRMLLTLRNLAAGAKVTVSAGLFEQSKPGTPIATKVLDVVEGKAPQKETSS